jgi:hypothetical protein
MLSQVHVRTEINGCVNHHELASFADFCAARIARDLHGLEDWNLYLVGGLEQSDVVVRVRAGLETVEARATACDPAHAIWTAMCRIEQPVRDAVAAARLTPRSAA